MNRDGGWEEKRLVRAEYRNDTMTWLEGRDEVDERARMLLELKPDGS